VHSEAIDGEANDVCGGERLSGIDLLRGEVLACGQRLDLRHDVALLTRTITAPPIASRVAPKVPRGRTAAAAGDGWRAGPASH